MNGDDAACARLARALLVLSKREGLTVFDPQRGEPVASASSLPWRAPAARGKTLKAKISNLVRTELAAFGFEARGSREVTRTLGPLEQGLEFQPLSRGRFTINAWWCMHLGKELVSGPTPAASTSAGCGGSRWITRSLTSTAPSPGPVPR